MLVKTLKGKNEMMITKDSIVGRNANGSIFHHGAAMPIPGWTRDAAPVGSEVGGIGTSSLGYAENSLTMRPIAGTQRADGAVRNRPLA
jgi:hypothetical protein